MLLSSFSRLVNIEADRLPPSVPPSTPDTHAPKKTRWKRIDKYEWEDQVTRHKKKSQDGGMMRCSFHSPVWITNRDVNFTVFCPSVLNPRPELKATRLLNLEHKGDVFLCYFCFKDDMKIVPRQIPKCKRKPFLIYSAQAVIRGLEDNRCWLLTDEAIIPHKEEAFSGLTALK